METPSRPIVSIRYSVTYEVAKELANIPDPLLDRSKHQNETMQNFIESIKDIILQQGEFITSYNATALFTSLLVDLFTSLGGQSPTT